MYKPEKWVVVKIKTDKETYFKVLGGWSGSYLEGQSWRLNSGVARVSVDGDYYLFEGHSGSVYKCHKNGYGANLIMQGVISQMTKPNDENVHVEVLEDQNFEKLMD